MILVKCGYSGWNPGNRIKICSCMRRPFWCGSLDSKLTICYISIQERADEESDQSGGSGNAEYLDDFGFGE